MNKIGFKDVYLECSSGFSMVLVVNISLKLPIYFINDAVYSTMEPNEPF